MLNRDKIVEETEKWLGTKWQHQGRSTAGIDCVGLIIRVGGELGVLAYDTTNYPRHGFKHDFLRQFRSQMDQKPVKQRQSGDVLLFRDSQFPCHCGIVISENEFIHAHAFERKVVKGRLDQGDWKSRVVACFSYRGVDDG